LKEGELGAKHFAGESDRCLLGKKKRKEKIPGGRKTQKETYTNPNGAPSPKRGAFFILSGPEKERKGRGEDI